MKNYFVRDIRKYYLFQFLNGLCFFAPVMVLFWQSHGLKMIEIMMLQSVYSLGVVVLDLPTGAFADCFGKRRSLILGTFFWTIAFIFYAFSTEFWQFALWELMAGVGSAFISGADRAYLHELLREENRAHEFRKTEGKARGIFQVSQGLGSVAGGLMGAVSLSWPLLATGISTIFSMFVGLKFPIIKEKETDEPRFGYIRTITKSFELLQEHRRLLWLSLFYACFHGLLWPLFFYAQVFLQFLHVPVYMFGVIFFGFNLIVAAGSALTHQFETLARNKVFLIMSVIVVLSLLIITVFPNVFTFALWSLFNTFVFMNLTIIADQVLKIVSRRQAATVLSLQSMMRRLLYALSGPILGFATDAWGVRITLLYYAFFLGLIFTGLLLLEKKMLDKDIQP